MDYFRHLQFLYFQQLTPPPLPFLPSLPLSGRYSTQHIIRFYKQRLASLPCQNQGFLLDGFPKTEEEARELFAGNER